MKSVKILVASNVGNGKSTVSQIIYNALISAGIDVTLSDIDFVDGYCPSLDSRIDILKDDLKVNIETVQLNRSCSDIDISNLSTKELVNNISTN